MNELERNEEWGFCSFFLGSMLLDLVILLGFDEGELIQKLNFSEWGKEKGIFISGKFRGFVLFMKIVERVGL